MTAYGHDMAAAIRRAERLQAEAAIHAAVKLPGITSATGTLRLTVEALRAAGYSDKAINNGLRANLFALDATE